MLSDIAAGRMVTRGPLVPLTESLMSRYSERDYRSPGEADAMVDRLLAIADDWYGAKALVNAVEAVIVDAPLPARPLGFQPVPGLLWAL
jgi:hypothetical protein